MIEQPTKRASARSAASVACALLVPVLTAGCSQSTLTASSLLTTGSTTPLRPTSRPPMTDDERLQTAATTNYRPRTASPRARSTVPTAAAILAQARKLRLAGQRMAALQLLDRSARQFPDNVAITAQRGLLALEVGRLPQAESLLRTALEKGAGDWRLRSALGATLAARGHHKQAAGELRAALRMSPDNPAILNNLAMSQAMAGNLKEAERILRRVVAKKARGKQLARANQNLALVLGLRGKHAEARRIATSTLPAATAKANVAYLQRLSSNVQISRASTPDPRSGRFAGLPQQPNQ
jgi:Flp pilus assembly protein TadD